MERASNVDWEAMLENEGLGAELAPLEAETTGDLLSVMEPAEAASRDAQIAREVESDGFFDAREQ